MNRLPTTDIFLRNACAPLMRRWWRGGGDARRPLREVAPNCFVCADSMVLIRRDSPRVMQAALNWPGRLVYLIDDDIAGAVDDAGLDSDYRQRLAAFHREFHGDLLRRADVLVVPSDPLAARLAAEPAIGAEIRRIEPCRLEPFADQRHYRGLAQGEPLRIAHLGSGSHRGALEALAPTLRRQLARHGDVELTYIAAPPALGPIADQPRARREPPRRWPAHRRWLRRQRFHLALYPLLPTAFDRARSANKLYEHAIVGAVGLYPQNWEPGRALAQDGPTPAALLAPADPSDWEAALEGAIAQRGELSVIAHAASKALSASDPRAMQQALWRDILSIDFD